MLQFNGQIFVSLKGIEIFGRGFLGGLKKPHKITQKIFVTDFGKQLQITHEIQCISACI